MQFSNDSMPWGLPMCRLSSKTLFTMRLTMVLLTVACIQVSARSVTQNITINAEKAPLKTIFKSIEKQTIYIFFYKPALLQTCAKINLHKQDIPVKTILEQCFKDQPFIYYIEG